MAREGCGHGADMAREGCGHGADMEREGCGHGADMEREGCGHGADMERQGGGTGSAERTLYSRRLNLAQLRWHKGGGGGDGSIARRLPPQGAPSCSGGAHVQLPTRAPCGHSAPGAGAGREGGALWRSCRGERYRQPIASAMKQMRRAEAAGSCRSRAAAAGSCRSRRRRGGAAGGSSTLRLSPRSRRPQR